MDTEKILQRKAGREAAQEVLSLVEMRDYASRDWRISYWEELAKVAYNELIALGCTKITEPEPEPEHEIPFVADDDQPLEVRRALAVIDEIEELAADVPDAGQDYAESVLKTAGDIGETIQQHRSVTPAQERALRNMRDGLARWIRL